MAVLRLILNTVLSPVDITLRNRLAMLETLTRIPLQELRSGQPANISCVSGNPQDVARLAEMGLRCGTQVCAVRGGNTCILQIEGHRMCVRTSKDLAILVTPA